jgi:hypothetical protein
MRFQNRRGEGQSGVTNRHHNWTDAAITGQSLQAKMTETGLKSWAPVQFGNNPSNAKQSIGCQVRTLIPEWPSQRKDVSSGQTHTGAIREKRFSVS